MDRMEWLETTPLPRVCQECIADDCYNCDHAGERWYPAKADELKLRRKGLLKAIERLQRKVAELDREIANFSGK